MTFELSLQFQSTQGLFCILLSVECYNLGSLLGMEGGCLTLSFPSSRHCDKDSNTVVHLGGDPRIPAGAK